MNKNLMIAALALAASPMPASAQIAHGRGPGSGLGDWLRANGKLSPKGKQLSKDPSRYAGRSFKERPKVDVPGYFWKQDLVGPLWRLYRSPDAAMLAQRKVIYDEVHDRSIIYSAWGYVNPSYHHGDLRTDR